MRATVVALVAVSAVLLMAAPTNQVGGLLAAAAVLAAGTVVMARLAHRPSTPARQAA